MAARKENSMALTESEDVSDGDTQAATLLYLLFPHVQISKVRP